MNAKTLLTLVLFATVLTSGPRTAQAAVMSRDWKTAGDGLLTYDDVNQREWLDVPETLLFNQGSFENIVAQTGAGELFAGFIPATSSDVFALAESAGIDIDSTSIEVNEFSMRHLIELLGETVWSSGSQMATYGLLKEFSNQTPSSQLVSGFVVVPPSGTSGIGVFPYLDFNGSLDGQAARFTGVMLYRQVPEPASSLMVLLGATLSLLTACFRRRAT